MTTVTSFPLEQPFATLRRFAGSRQPLERCELCSAMIAPGHAHLLELASRQILCACDACATLFDGMERGRYKRVSRRVWFLSEFRISDCQWDDLLIPIGMAFFFHSSSQAKTIALYPSPAGAVESLLPLDAWSNIVGENPLLAAMEPDVEALLANRVGHTHGSSPAEYYLAPIDQCFKLVGLIRTRWKGLSGGNEVWMEIADFFSTLRTHAEPMGGETRA